MTGQEYRVRTASRPGAARACGPAPDTVPDLDTDPPGCVNVPWCAVGPDPLDPAGMEALVRDPHAGATVTFTGVVRDTDTGRTVTALTYEAHPDAATHLDHLLRTVAAAPPALSALAAAHRTGRRTIGEVAFVAAVSAPHRREAFAACADLVDAVKHSLPVWKLQEFADGTTEWVNAL